VSARRSLAGLIALAASVLPACTQSTQTITLQSLEGSGTASFICVGEDGAPRDLKYCPDVNIVDGEDRHLYSLVTQTTRGQVAVVDLTYGGVVDEESTIPGYNFLDIGGVPTDIASTPGSVASFVGVAENGKEGIFALPTTCVSPRRPTEPLRDITTWPACSLPSAPGKMTVLVDPAIDLNGDGIADVVRERCDDTKEVSITTPDPVQAHSDCPADLSLENDPPGRRKLLVELPDKGLMAVIDAQEILDRQPGSFEPCPIENYVPLDVNPLPEPIPQRLPADFSAPGAIDASCAVPTRPAGFVHPPADFSSWRPAGLARIDEPGDHRLFVTDLAAPVIHVFDTSDPCKLTQAPPLLPESYVDPNRVVLTGHAAVSPITTTGERFLYAIDERDSPAASVMMFDVSPGAANRTPILRPRSALFPFEAPDRIAFDTPAQDVTFARYVPGGEPDPVTGTEGFVQCDPKPSTPITAPGAEYRSNSDFTLGARPGELRGTFGFVVLTNGQIAVIDVDDLDAPCRRPIYTNQSATEDFRGCEDDPSFKYFTLDNGTNPSGQPTVTNEASCRVVEENRSRSTDFIINDPNVGIFSPSLSSLPKLVTKEGQTLVTDSSQDGRKNPKMLAVNFSPTEPAQVFVSSTLFQSGSTENPLPVDPTTATSSSLVLDLKEPRAYVPSENFSARFEGPIAAERVAGVLTLHGATATLTDGVVFCEGIGVDDEQTAAARGVAEFGVAPADAALFGKEHADLISVSSDLFAETDPYWQTPQGAACAGADPNQPRASYLACRDEFGPKQDPKDQQRDLRIISASPSSLELEPRSGAGAQLLQDINCCFPEAFAYDIRASNEWVVTGSGSGFRHDVITGPDGTCQRDACNPLKAHLKSRVLEVSCAGGAACNADYVDPVTNHPAGIIGFADTGATSATRDVACVISNPKTDLTTLGGPQSQCIYDGLTSHFVIYRGTIASERDSEFDWTVLGGFSPLLIDLSTVGDTSTSPQAILQSPAQGTVIVVDGASKGLVVVDLATFALSSYF